MSFGANQYDAPLGANQSVGVIGSQSQWEEPSFLIMQTWLQTSP